VRAALAALALAAACASAPRSGEDLLESVRTYHEGVRWQRFPVAAGRVPPAQRDDFLQERDQLSEDLRITDYEVLRVRSTSEGRAEVEVKWTWFLDSDGRVKETRAVEHWERHGKVWLLVDERRARGETMPGLAEPPDDAGVPGGADAGASDGALAPVP